MHGPDAINGYHQLEDREPLQRLGETSTNPSSNSWTPHPTQPRVGAIANLGEWATSWRSMQQMGQRGAEWQWPLDGRPTGKGVLGSKDLGFMYLES